jgi:hypothetical protein
VARARTADLNRYRVRQSGSKAKVVFAVQERSKNDLRDNNGAMSVALIGIWRWNSTLFVILVDQCSRNKAACVGMKIMLLDLTA